MISFGIATLFTMIASGLALYAFHEAKRATDVISEKYVADLNATYTLALLSQSIATKSVALASANLQASRQSVADAITDGLLEMNDVIESLEGQNIENLNLLRDTKKDLLEIFKEIDELVSRKVDIEKKQKIVNRKVLRSHNDFDMHVNQLGHDLKGDKALSLNEIRLLGIANHNLILSVSSADNKGQLKRLKLKLDENLQLLMRRLKKIDNDKKITKLSEQLGDYAESTNNAFSLREKELRVNEAIKEKLLAYEANSNRLIYVAYSVTHEVEEKINAATTTNQNKLKNNGIYLIIITIICAIASLKLAFSIGKNIGSRIESLKKSMDLHAGGGNEEVVVDGDDEIGQMGKTLKVFINKIRSREVEIKNAHDQLGHKLQELELAKNALQESEEKFRDFAGVAADWFWEMDEHYRFSYVQGYALPAVGITSDELLGKTLEEVVKHKVELPLMLEHKPFEDEEIEWPLDDGGVVFFRISARPLYDQHGKFSGYRGTGSDVTEAHRLSKKLFYQANHDPLTGLYNRNAFELHLKKALSSVKEDGSEHALCYLDLDQFKVINDTCGHVAGDELLSQLSTILTKCVRQGDVVARLGGDEFGVLLENCPINVAENIAHNLREAVHDFRFAWGEHSFSVGVSIGLVSISDISIDYSELMKMVDAACYAAKDQGRNRVHIYSEADEDLSKRHGEMQWVSRISAALDNDLFEIFGQPIVPIGGDNPGYYYEILVRMHGSDGNLISPGAFLPAAERYGLAPRLDLWVIERTLLWLQKKPDHLQKLYLCSINLSAFSLANENLFDSLSTLIDLSEVPAEKICFEITETAAISNLTRAKQLIESLKLLGFKFALDDFGSGFSWLGMLRTLPVDFLKVDGSFVRDICNDPVRQAIVSSIHSIGELMDKKTIAEFVESREVINLLEKIGIDYVQGNAIIEPILIDDLTGFFENLNKI